MYTHASESSRLLTTDSRWSLANQDTSPSPLLSSTDGFTLQDLLRVHSRSPCDHEDTAPIELDAKFEEVSLISPYPDAPENSPTAHRSSLGRGLPSTMRRSNGAKRFSQSSACLRNGFTDARSPSFWTSPSPLINDCSALNRPSSSHRTASSPLTGLAYWRKLIGFALCGSTENSPESTQFRRASAAEYVDLGHSVAHKHDSPEDRPSSIDIPVYQARRPPSRRILHTRQRATHRQARRTSRRISRPIACSPPRQDELEWQAQYCVSPEPLAVPPSRLVGLGFYGGLAPDFNPQDQAISLNESRRQLEAKRQVYGRVYDVLF